jgi:hypothetical protein
MTIETIQRAFRAVPFVPFTLHLADGRSFHVPHTDFAAYHPRGRIVSVYPIDRPDAPEQIDLLLVVSIDHGDEVASPSSG